MPQSERMSTKLPTALTGGRSAPHGAYTHEHAGRRCPPLVWEGRPDGRFAFGRQAGRQVAV